MPLKRRDETKELVKQIEETTRKPVEKESVKNIVQVVSTGSTLLDLAISGGRIRGGGIPGGIIAEIFGPSGAGKTSILAEICASAQSRGGVVDFLDPEARLDKEYARIYGVEIDKTNYYRPDTVTDVFDRIWKQEVDPSVINVVATDSLAALSTKMEMEDQDKMGMRRAKEFSEGLRKTARLIKNSNRLIVCSNQVREGSNGEVTPGGQAIRFYSSLRIRIGPPATNANIVRTIKVGDKEVKKVVGIKSQCVVKKSSIDDPFRFCFVSILFGYGVDSIRDELQFVKDTTGVTTYECPDGKTFRGAEATIAYIEEMKLQSALKEKVIDLWQELEDKFKIEREPKKR